MVNRTVKPVRQWMLLMRGARHLATCAALLAGLTLIAACGGNVSFNRETGQFSVPLGGNGQGSNR